MLHCSRLILLCGLKLILLQQMRLKGYVIYVVCSVMLLMKHSSPSLVPNADQEGDHECLHCVILELCGINRRTIELYNWNVA